MGKSKEKNYSSFEEAGESIKKKWGEREEGREGKSEGRKGETHDLGAFGVWEEPKEKKEEKIESKPIELKPQEQEKVVEPFSEKDAENLVKNALGSDIFEREEKVFEQEKEAPLREPRSLGAAAAKEKKSYYRDAFDERIGLMTQRLKNLENSSKIFDKKATPKQKEEEGKKRQELMEDLKKGIEEAKSRKEKISVIKDKKSEKTEIKLKQPVKKEKHYIYEEIDRLGKNIVLAKKELREAKTDEEKKKAEENIKYFTVEFEKAKGARDRIKDSFKIREGKEIKIRSQVEVDVAESQPETYGKTYAMGSAPEDALEKGQILKNLGKQKKFKKEEGNTINKIEIVSPIGGKIFSEEKLKEAQEATESLRKTKEKIAEFERVIESGDIHEPVIEPTPGEEVLMDEEKKIEAEKHLAAVEKQENKIEEEIKQEKPWVREKIEKAANWYKKQPFWKKIIVSVGCMSAASASAFIGGAAGATIATAAFAGSISQRALGGLATFITAEGLLKKSAEKGGRERTKAEAMRHTVEAALLGLLVGSGQAARGVKEIADVTGVSDVVRNAYEFWFPKSEIKIMPSDVSPASQVAVVPEIPQEVSQIAPKFQIAENMEIKKGDSIWSVAKRYLESNDEFQKLGGVDAKAAEALQTYNIDRVKDIILANPEKYGLAAGIDTQDLTNLSVDDLKNIKWGDALNDAIKEKDGLLANLPQEKIDSIIQNNATLRHFFQEYPSAPRTAGNYEDIIKGHGDTGIVESTGAGEIDDSGGETDDASGEPEKEPATKETTFNDVQKWLENKAKIDVEKSSWLNEKSLGKYTVKQVMDSGFVKPQGIDAYTSAEPEWGSPQYWEFKEKDGLQNQIGKILRSMPIGERAEFQNVSVINFLKEYLKVKGE